MITELWQSNVSDSSAKLYLTVEDDDTNTVWDVTGRINFSSGLADMTTYDRSTWGEHCLLDYGDNIEDIRKGNYNRVASFDGDEVILYLWLMHDRTKEYFAVCH
jgi:hypothetical protein